MPKFESLLNKVKKTIEKARGKEKKRKSISQIYEEYIYSSMEPRELLALLEKEDVEDFIRYRESEREKLLPDADRKLFFKINQLNNLVEAGLEDAVEKAHGKNIVKRWD